VDDQGYDDFYRSTSRRTVRYAYAMIGDAGTAQDITQEAYIRAWRHWATVSGYDHPESWVRLIVTRLATDWWRRVAVRRRHEAADRPPEAVPPPSENTVVLVEALRTLPPRQRQVMCLHYLLDLSVADIARETGVAEGTVKSWLSRARSALAVTMAPDGVAPVPRPRTAQRRRGVKEDNGVS
jgi:RNA polymerase sigma-70 factor (ECF subfamily)